MSIPPHTHPLFEDPNRPWGPPLTDAGVDSFEKLLGLTIPVALRAVLLRTNGGSLRRTHIGAAAGRTTLRIRDLAGIGYAEGLEASPSLATEWGYPRPCLVLSAEGPRAFLLDYRRSGPHGEPAVVFVDTDQEVAGRPLEWTLSPTIGAFLERLTHWNGRTVVFVPDLDADAVVELIQSPAIGGDTTVRPDHGRGQTVALPGWRGLDGAARARVLPTCRPDGSVPYPELQGLGSIFESTVHPDVVDQWLRKIGPALPPGSRLLHRRT